MSKYISQERVLIEKTDEICALHEKKIFHSHPIAGKENGLEKPVCPVTRQG
jgi:hypothetical protein